MLHSLDKIANEKFVTPYADTDIYTRAEFESDAIAWQAAKEKFARVPAGSYKLITVVQARQTGSANDKIFFPQAQSTEVWSGVERHRLL